MHRLRELSKAEKQQNHDRNLTDQKDPENPEKLVHNQMPPMKIIEGILRGG